MVQDNQNEVVLRNCIVTNAFLLLHSLLLNIIFSIALILLIIVVRHYSLVVNKGLFGRLLVLCFEERRIYLVLSSLKQILSLSSTIYWCGFGKSWFSCFSASLTLILWKAKHISSASKKRFLFTATSIPIK